MFLNNWNEEKKTRNHNRSDDDGDFRNLKAPYVLYKCSINVLLVYFNE